MIKCFRIVSHTDALFIICKPNIELSCDASSTMLPFSSDNFVGTESVVVLLHVTCSVHLHHKLFVKKED